MTGSSILELLKNRIDLHSVPFTDRGSRILVFREDHSFLIRLAERWYKRSLQLSAYRLREPIITRFVLTDGDGHPLDFSLATYPHRLDAITKVGAFTILFADPETLLISFPASTCGIAFQANLDKAQTDRRGGVLRLTGDIRRNVAYTTGAPILVNQVNPTGPATQEVRLIVDATLGDGELLLNITPRLGFNRYLLPAGCLLDEATQRWAKWFSDAPPVLEQYRSQYYFAWWVMRAGLISPRYFTTREAMTPSKMYYVGIWQWDAYFHSLAYRHIDRRLAQDQLRLLLDHQREDGMIPDAIHDEGIVDHLDLPVTADVTKPPLVAWAAWKLYEVDHDVEFLNEIYEAVTRNNRWWFEQNDRNGNGLCEYGHPFSSGLDDSPLWDGGMPVESPDLNTYLCMQQCALANIARVIGQNTDSEMWWKRAETTLKRMVDVLWDDQAGLFWAKRDGQQISIRTPFNLFPLITGRLTPEMSARLVARLTDESQFWPRFPVPSVALNENLFDPNQMWRGPTWVNINYLLIEGLFKAGYPELGKELRRRTLELIGGQADIYEYYNPLTGQAPPKAAAIFGWTSAVFIDLAIQASIEEG